MHLTYQYPKHPSARIEQHGGYTATMARAGEPEGAKVHCMGTRILGFFSESLIDCLAAVACAAKGPRDFCVVEITVTKALRLVMGTS